jgi:hypothetical protein
MKIACASTVTPPHSSILKIEEAGSTETFITFRNVTRRHTPEDSNFHEEYTATIFRVEE